MRFTPNARQNVMARDEKEARLKTFILQHIEQQHIEGLRDPGAIPGTITYRLLALSAESPAALALRDVAADLSQPLPFREQHDQALDRRSEHARLDARPVRQQADQVGMPGEIVELAREGGAEALERRAITHRSRCEGLLELHGSLPQDRVEEPALRLEVVEQQLAIDAGRGDDPVYPPTRESPAGELLSTRQQDPYRLVIAELPLHCSKCQLLS